MQCIASTVRPTTSASMPLTLSPRSLAAAFARVPDPRRVKSTIYTLPAMLTMTVAALLSHHLSVLAIAAWGARQTPEVVWALGFADGHTPCQSTLQRLFCKLDGHALSVALSAHFEPPAIPVPAAEEGLRGVAVAGRRPGLPPAPDLVRAGPAQRGRALWDHQSQAGRRDAPAPLGAQTRARAD